MRVAVLKRLGRQVCPGYLGIFTRLVVFECSGNKAVGYRKDTVHTGNKVNTVNTVKTVNTVNTANT